MAPSKVISSKSKSKLTKKELKQDRLVEFTVRAESFYRQYQKWVIGSAIAILVIILAIIVISRSHQSAIMTESYDLTMAKVAYGAGQLDEARQAFEKVVSQHGGRAAGEAGLFLARIAFEKGDFAGAEAGFRDYISNYSIDEAMDATALSGLAASLEAEGKLDASLAEYEKFAERYPDVAYAPESLLQVSRLAQKLNQPDKARRALQQIVDKYPQATEAQQARRELDSMG